MSKCRRLHRCRGFTLIEMVVVIAILGLASGGMYALLRPPSDAFRLEMATRELCGALRLARTRAIASGQEAVLAVNIARRVYHLPPDKERPLPQDVVVKMTIALAMRDGDQVGSFRFYPSGAASGGDIALELGGHRRSIGVGWVSGQALCGL
jgi:general secretion pathway protein H